METLTNSTGQVPKIPGLPTLIDDATPMDAYERIGLDGEEYKLVFSDEVRPLFLLSLVVLAAEEVVLPQFNQDGRTFWPGDDPCVPLAPLNQSKMP